MLPPTEYLAAGYANIRPGQIATVVTALIMTERPPVTKGRTLDRPLVVERIHKPDPNAYRALFRRIGEDWLWFSRLVMSDADLAAVLADPAVEVFVLRDGPAAIGLLELDFRGGETCELAFFGLVPEAIGSGAGRFLMNKAIDLAWSRPIKRLWLHTCSFDHPGAMDFYRRSGFRPFALQIEVADDPRLTGVLPRSAAPHVPLIDPAAFQ